MLCEPTSAQATSRQAGLRAGGEEGLRQRRVWRRGACMAPQAPAAPCLETRCTLQAVLRRHPRKQARSLTRCAQTSDAWEQGGGWRARAAEQSQDMDRASQREVWGHRQAQGSAEGGLRAPLHCTARRRLALPCSSACPRPQAPSKRRRCGLTLVHLRAFSEPMSPGPPSQPLQRGGRCAGCVCASGGRRSVQGRSSLMPGAQPQPPPRGCEQAS